MQGHSSWKWYIEVFKAVDYCDNVRFYILKVISRYFGTFHYISLHHFPMLSLPPTSSPTYIKYGLQYFAHSENTIANWSMVRIDNNSDRPSSIEQGIFKNSKDLNITFSLSWWNCKCPSWMTYPLAVTGSQFGFRPGGLTFGGVTPGVGLDWLLPKGVAIKAYT